MPVGDKIRTVEYNTVQSRVANVLGTGSGNTGYGQPVQSSQVTTSNNISVNDWGALRNDIINIYRHQTNNIPDTTILPNAIEGASIRYNVTDAPVTVWDSLSTTLQNNRVNALPVGRFGTRDISPRTSGAASWGGSATVSVTFTWGNAESARFFFNSGGRLRILTTLEPNSVENQSTSWATFLSTVGTREWGGYFPNTGTSPIDGTNYWRADATERRIVNLSNTATDYTSNRYELYVTKSDSTTVTLRVNLVDGYTDPGPDPPGDAVIGELTLTVSYTYGDGATTPGPATWLGYEPNSVVIGNWTFT